jgi:hypothetical protein
MIWAGEGTLYPIGQCRFEIPRNVIDRHGLGYYSVIGIDRSFDQRDQHYYQALFKGTLFPIMEDSYYAAMGRAGGLSQLSAVWFHYGGHYIQLLATAPQPKQHQKKRDETHLAKP